jgi:outer membrane protein assembly factor BamB
LVERPCVDAEEAATCLERGEPDVRVQIGGDQELLWLRGSPSLERAVVAVAPAARAAMKKWRSTLVGLDLVEQKELWRCHLAEQGDIQPRDAIFVGDDIVVVRTKTAALVALDAASGTEIWRRDHGTQKRVQPVHMAWLDPAHEFLLIGGEPTLVDARSGEVLDVRESFRPKMNMRVIGRDPVLDEEAVYAYDAGLLKVSRQERRFEWGREFVTFAEENYAGQDVGKAVAAVFVGALTGLNVYPTQEPHDYWVGRTPEPVLGEPLIVGSLGLVLALDPASGEVLWGVDLAVPQVASLAVADGVVYALAGGQHVLWHGQNGPSVAEPVRYGLYALDVATGEPVEQFQFALNRNAVHERLDAERLRAYDEDDARDTEEKWVEERFRGESSPGGESLRPFTDVRLVDMELTAAGLLVATADEILLIDRRSGKELRRAPLGSLGVARAFESVGEVVVLRSTTGLAAIDPRTGDVLWQRETEPASAGGGPPVRAGHVPYVAAIDYLPFINAERKKFGDCLFWLDEQAGLVIVRDGPADVVGFDVESGTERFRIPGPANIVMDRPGDACALVFMEGDEAEIYRLP